LRCFVIKELLKDIFHLFRTLPVLLIENELFGSLSTNYYLRHSDCTYSDNYTHVHIYIYIPYGCRFLFKYMEKYVWIEGVK
jgi:hypothetical protein